MEPTESYESRAVQLGGVSEEQMGETMRLTRWAEANLEAIIRIWNLILKRKRGN